MVAIIDLYSRKVLSMKVSNSMDLRETTKGWVSYSNSDRLHQSLEYKSPNEVCTIEKQV